MDWPKIVVCVVKELTNKNVPIEKTEKLIFRRLREHFEPKTKKTIADFGNFILHEYFLTLKGKLYFWHHLKIIYFYVSNDKSISNICINKYTYICSGAWLIRSERHRKSSTENVKKFELLIFW